MTTSNSRSAGGERRMKTEIELVRLVLSTHQTAYAKFHNGEGRGVIESDAMAIGYASVELAKALAAQPARRSEKELREIAELARARAFEAEREIHGKPTTANNFHEIADKLEALVGRKIV